MPPPTITRQVAIYLLLALVLVLPLFEVLKNLAALGLVAATLLLAHRDRRFDAVDKCFSLLLVAEFVSAFFSAYPNEALRQIGDPIRYLLIAWAAYRLRPNASERGQIILFATIGSLAAIAWGAYEYFALHARPFWELRSVGHVNHSTIYVALTAMGGLFWLVFADKPRGWTRYLIAPGVAVQLGYIYFGESRATLFSVLLLLVFSGILAARYSRKIFALTIATSLLAVVAGFGLGIHAFEKHLSDVAQNNTFSYRLSIWDNSLEVFRAHPLFGIGRNQFQRIKVDDIADMKAARNAPFDRSTYLHFPHAHSFYFTLLAEKGLFGVIVVLGWLAFWFFRLVRAYFDASNDRDTVAWTFISFSTLWVLLVNGFGNTTLHHEHGMMTMLLFALFLARTSSASTGEKNI